MKNTIEFKITTLSNLFIGGAPEPFEIGGIDQHTVRDQEGCPYIPASSLKGTLRAIIGQGDDSPAAEEMVILYKKYLDKMYEEYTQWLLEVNKKDQTLAQEMKDKKKQIEERFKQAEQYSVSDFLFGLEGFNNMPRLFFCDLILCEDSRKKGGFYSIDMKNSITADTRKPESNPRTYQTARSGLSFSGAIRLYKIGELGDNAELLCREIIHNNLSKFNDGICRLGNSKSRGYGKVRYEAD